MLFPEITLYPSSQLYPGMPLARTPTRATISAPRFAGTPASDHALGLMLSLLSQTSPSSDDSAGLLASDTALGDVNQKTTRSDIEPANSEALILG